ncbi:hypothetical protein IIY24_00090, partial [Candidatus Saccharibacteria bacterium]|nr:hypothetical protein [Candidatus Saccharibacteria bacterium]
TNAAPPTIEDLEYMQEFATLSSGDRTYILNSMTTDAQYQLKDSRDEKTYYVSKLRDGNVWMTQNLDHDIVTTANFYTPDNTDIPANWTASAGTLSSGASWTGSDTTLVSQDRGDLYWSGVVGDNNFVSSGDPHYHLGNTYNWTAAVAMNDSSSIGSDILVNQSICPAGWKLPRTVIGLTTDDNEVYALWTQYGYTKASGYEGDYSGSFSNASTIWNAPLYYTLTDGFSDEFWSSQTYDDDDFYESYSFFVDADTNISHHADYLSRQDPESIRCLVR